MFEGVKAFQKREGLPVDGIARPGGTTEQMLNVALSERATQKSAAEREASRQAHRRDAARAPSLASPARRAGARRAGGRADDTAVTGLRGTGSRGIGLRGTVGPRGTNAGADLATTRRALERAGLLDAHDVGRGPQAARPDEGLLDAVIRNVQRRHGLAQDGTITPGGPTDRRLARILDADRIMHTVPRLDTEEDAGAPGAGNDDDAGAHEGVPGEAVFGNTHDRTVRTAQPAFGNTANAEARAMRTAFTPGDGVVLGDARSAPLNRADSGGHTQTASLLVVPRSTTWPMNSFGPLEQKEPATRIPHRLGDEAQIQKRLGSVSDDSRMKFEFLRREVLRTALDKGMDDAAEVLELYLVAAGRHIHPKPEKMLSFPAVAAAEEKNRKRFDEDWLEEGKLAHEMIKNLRDGETVTIEPRFNKEGKVTTGSPTWSVSINPFILDELVLSLWHE